MTIRIKVLERAYPETLEEAVNEFLDCLPFEPTKITFGNSFNTFGDDYRIEYRPTYTAVIEYLAVGGNIDAVAAYDDTIG